MSDILENSSDVDVLSVEPFNNANSFMPRSCEASGGPPSSFFGVSSSATHSRFLLVVVVVSSCRRGRLIILLLLCYVLFIMYYKTMFNKTSRSDQYCVAARNPIFTISSSSETFCTSSVVSRETNEAIDKGVSLTSKVTLVSVEVPTRRLLEFRDDTKEVFFFILLVDQTDVSLNYGLAARQFQTLRIFVFVLYGDRLCVQCRSRSMGGATLRVR